MCTKLKDLHRKKQKKERPKWSPLFLFSVFEKHRTFQKKISQKNLLG
jgi:hypothetical protein